MKKIMKEKESNFISWNRSKIGKTYEEIYGEERAKQIKLKMRKKKIGLRKTKETKKRMSLSKLDKPNKEKFEFMKKMLKDRKITPNEMILNGIIKKNNFPFNYVGDGKVIFGGFCPDFLSKNPKYIIELFGSRHYSPYDKIRDKRRVRVYSSLGYKTLIIYNWELDKSKNHRINVVNKIKNFINQK